MKIETLKAAARFHSLAETAAKHGGFWVSAAGGTQNVAAGEIARATGDSFEVALRALDLTGREYWGTRYWYADLAFSQPGWVDGFDREYRWDARTIARAAVRGALK